MGDFVIQNVLIGTTTTVSNQFIDKYMPSANGEFVKIYLYLLRMTESCSSLSLEAIADIFDCTERDVVRALRYWEKAGILKLTFENRKLTSVSFLELPQQSEAAETPKIQPSPAVHKKAEPAPPEVKEEIPGKKALSAGEKRQLQEKEDVRQFLYIAEQYLGRTLTKTDTDNLLYFYSELNFNAELIEYLIEYCVSKGSRSARYIETVALAWASEGIATVKDAKKSTNLYNKNYFTVLKAMGIKNRNPVDTEVAMMDTWLREYGFSLDIITAACNRTIIQTGNPSFKYTDTILKDWKKKNVKHLSDLEALDEAHKKKVARMPASKSAPPAKGTKFSQYPHREYDYDEIKKSLLNK